MFKTNSHINEDISRSDGTYVQVVEVHGGFAIKQFAADETFKGWYTSSRRWSKDQKKANVYPVFMFAWNDVNDRLSY